ncbi:hypothetical protein [Flavobacterium sp. MAHUQ-51]
MQAIQGISRYQPELSNLEVKITADNPIRFIDVFVKTMFYIFKNSIVSHFNFSLWLF